MAPDLSIHAVALAGGAGTRFWPVSRRRLPKHLLTLGGEATLLQATFARLGPLAPPQRRWLVTGAGLLDACRKATPEVPLAQALVEPTGRNTAPAIGLAAVHVAAADPEAILVVLPADHHVEDPGALVAALETAAQLAAQGPLVTLGIQPSGPETGFGYVERGEADARVAGTFRVERFCEKPDRPTAERFVAGGMHLWNAGIFVMRPRAVLAEIERQLPATHAALQTIGAAVGTPTYDETLAAMWPRVDATSFDYGIMEGAREVGVVGVECGWSDVGAWPALGARIAADDDGNVCRGRVAAVDTRNSVLYADGESVVGAVGLDGMVVVHTADATLVVAKDRAQEVRAIIEKAENNGWTEVL